MTQQVDLLIANQNTLPWLKLMISQYRRLKPSIPSDLIICDNGSTDGSVEWLASSGIRHVLQTRRAHYCGLMGAMSLSSAPYGAFFDVDALPIKSGWLDEPIAHLQNEKIGAAGLARHMDWRGRRKFIHPSFCVFRRELYNRLSLDPQIVHADGFSYDVGELMSAKIEDNGFSLEFIGRAFISPEEDPQKCGNKVFHAGTSCWMLSSPSLDDEAIKNTRVNHRGWLHRLGLWGEFLKYLKESEPYNSFCKRYY